MLLLRRKLKIVQCFLNMFDEKDWRKINVILPNPQMPTSYVRVRGEMDDGVLLEYLTMLGRDTEKLFSELSKYVVLSNPHYTLNRDYGKYNFTFFINYTRQPRPRMGRGRVVDYIDHSVKLLNQFVGNTMKSSDVVHSIERTHNSIKFNLNSPSIEAMMGCGERVAVFMMLVMQLQIDKGHYYPSRRYAA